MMQSLLSKIILPSFAFLFATTATVCQAYQDVTVQRNRANSYVIRITEGTHLCSGVLISPKHILTAAHCLIGLNQDLTLLASANEIRMIKKIVPHPSFRIEKQMLGLWGEVAYADLALIEIHGRFSATPIPIDASNNVVREGSRVKMLGLGITSGGDDGILRKTDGVITKQTFLNSHELYLRIDGLGSLPGDSGGPVLTASGHLIGIQSWTDGQSYSVATGLRGYLSWLRQVR